MQNNETYITQAPLAGKDNALRSYVNNLQSKIGYAKWKQNLILNYNYLPLTNIKQKLEADFASYSRKMESEQAKLRSLVDNKQITTIMSQLNGFKAKLLEDVQKTEKKIQSQRIVVKNLQNQAKIRKQKLKLIIKDNRNNLSQKLKEGGIKTARDIKNLIRSKSTLSNVGSYTTRVSLGSQNKKQPIKVAQVYKMCLKSLIPSQVVRNRQKKQILQNENRKQSGHNSLKSHRNEIQNYYSAPVHIINQTGDQTTIKAQMMSWESFNRLKFDQIIQILQSKNQIISVLQQLLA